MLNVCVYVCVCVRVCARARVCVCVCVCVRDHAPVEEAVHLLRGPKAFAQRHLALYLAAARVSVEVERGLAAMRAAAIVVVVVVVLLGAVLVSAAGAAGCAVLVLAGTPLRARRHGARCDGAPRRCAGSPEELRLMGCGGVVVTGRRVKDWAAASPHSPFAAPALSLSVKSRRKCNKARKACHTHTPSSRKSSTEGDTLSLPPSLSLTHTHTTHTTHTQHLPAMDVITALYKLPFAIVRPPVYKPKSVSLSSLAELRPSGFTVFVAILISYFLVTGGIIYGGFRV
jgi:hypothetical protein